MSEYTLDTILPDRISEKWDSVVPWIEKWLAQTLGEYILTDIYKLISSDEWQCWIIKRKGVILGIALTAVTPFPQFNILQVVGVAGVGATEWSHLIAELEEWGRMNGCAKISGYGRLGWERVMKSFGFSRQYSVITKDI